MARYVDGYVLAVPRRNTAAYLRIARQMRKICLEHGALEYYECIGDDVKPGKLTSFPQSVKLRQGEVVWLSWVVFRSRRHRDAVNAKVMADPRVQRYMGKKMPFDDKRMFFGGFKVAVAP